MIGHLVIKNAYTFVCACVCVYMSNTHVCAQNETLTIDKGTIFKGT